MPVKWVETLFLQLIDGADCSEDLSNRVQQGMDCIWRPILCGKDRYYCDSDLFVKRRLERSISAAQPGEERRQQLRRAMSITWPKIVCLSPVDIVATVETLVLDFVDATKGTENSKQKIQKGIDRIWFSILAARDDSMRRHASTMCLIKEAKSCEEIKELMQAEIRCAWPMLALGRDRHRCERVQALLLHLLSTTRSRAELRHNLWKVTEPFRMAEGVVLSYMDAFDYDILGATGANQGR